jgi:peptidoglycan/xylan/chitin deacetylase (PgdA/CDA1 family)
LREGEISKAEMIRNELDIAYRRPILFRALVLSGLRYQNVPFQLRNLYGRVFRRKSNQRTFPSDTSGNDPGTESPWKGTFALCLTHDIDTKYGMDRGADLLMDIERRHDLVSTWFVVAGSREYLVNAEKLRRLRSMRNEIASHCMYHDGKFAFVGPAEREMRIAESRRILDQLGFRPKGFRVPLLHRTRDMVAILERNEFAWDSSYPDVDPSTIGYEGTGCGSIFPFHPLMRTNGELSHAALLEMPITLPQDWTLFHSFGLSDGQVLKLWRWKLKQIADLGGLALMVTHPDSYDSGSPTKSRLYDEFIRHAVSMSPVSGTCSELASSWKENEGVGGTPS